MRRDSSRLSWRGPRPGPIAATVTEHRRSPARAGRSGHRPRLRHDGTVGGQRVFGLADWHRDGTLAEYVADRGTQPRAAAGRRRLHGGREPADLGPDRVAGTVRARPPSGGAERPRHGAAGAVGSMVTQLAREAGAYVIGTGRAADRQKALDFGAQEFVDLEQRRAGRRRRRRPGVRRHRRRHPEAVRRPDSSRRNTGDPSSARPRRGPPTAWRSTSLSSPIVPN
jgi:NADPH:quinone reductase and related Zn-dependent oxidoreductases